MFYQPDEEPQPRSRPPWMRIIALLLVSGLVLMTAGATIQMLLAAS